MITICMNDRQYVITDIQEHLYVRKSEYVLFRSLPLERLGAVSNGNEAEFENVWSPFFCSLPQNISQVCKKAEYI